jgi:thiol-disulfide isomerase/thioredoxin
MIHELIVSIIVVVVTISIYYYIRKVPPGAKMIVQDIPPFSEAVDLNTARLMFFWVGWCPYCKTAMEQWKSLKQVINTNKYRYGGKTITYESINAEVDTGKASQYNIKYYPTIKVQTNDKLYEMVGHVNVANLREFLTKAVGNETSQ